MRAARQDADIAVDFRFDLGVDTLRAAVRGADIVINCVGILIERDGNTWDGVHRRATEALAAACEAERVARVVQISALGAGTGIPGAFMASKLAAEQAFEKHSVDFGIASSPAPRSGATGRCWRATVRRKARARRFGCPFPGG